jgi:hypothetical protein
LRAGDRSQTLTEVAAQIETLRDETRAQVDFQLVGANTHGPASILVVRNHESSPPATRIELSTDDNKLPCSLLALGLDELKPLGERCRFHGLIRAVETPEGWDADVTGHLIELDLDSLVTNRFPHRLSGIGNATIRSARFRHGCLEECNGELIAGRGTISRSLLKAAGEYLGLIPGAGPFPAGDRIGYEELAVSFTLDAGGLRLQGLCTTAEPHTILSDGRNRLLGESTRDRQPVTALVQTLAPPRALQVPASRQTDWLLHHLQISDVSVSPAAESVPLNARLHLRDKWQ